ncbi:hypothetical protein EVAR_56205_1 [Eumeta japonica]|uniref:Uncharacterized protein n=1 Tax=Eumeta variegata TaxID=151549 RepID=A0A4C1Y5T8_EUMVA|nr:hypothetical protein EVAR_56205_1 [Eumeta japonica]
MPDRWLDVLSDAQSVWCNLTLAESMDTNFKPDYHEKNFHMTSPSQRSSGIRHFDASQAERLGRSCLSIARSALSLARSAQAERDNESCFFVRAAGVHRFIRRYHVKNYQSSPDTRMSFRWRSSFSEQLRYFAARACITRKNVCRRRANADTTPTPPGR